MKKYHALKIFLLSLITGLAVFTPVYADGLGRLFTSPEERIKLDKIRNARPVPEKIEVVEVEEIMVPIEEEKNKDVMYNTIILKGLVRRSDGKNTAWINNSNTYEGDLESQYINIDEQQITAADVTIVMPDNETEVKIKVGDRYQATGKSDR